MNSDSVEEILDRHFQIEGAIIRVFEPFQAKAALLALLEAEAEILRVQKGNARASVMMEIKAIPLERIKELFGAEDDRGSETVRANTKPVVS